jgi:hypothetical protein
MTRQLLIEKLTAIHAIDNSLFKLAIDADLSIQVYPKSIHKSADVYFLIGKIGPAKHLYVISLEKQSDMLDGFVGKVQPGDHEFVIKQCELDHANAESIRGIFSFTRPVLIGLHNSFGYGDRLGIANPAHVRAAMESKMKPILAQQSIRELQRTARQPEEVMDAASWAVFQEGYHEGFGSDADHLKTEEDIDLMVKAGFTMFTIDPSAFVINEADSMSADALIERAKSLPWSQLNDTVDGFLKRYEGQTIEVTKDFALRPTREQVLRGLVKYGGVIAHTAKLYSYLETTYPEHPREVEVSVDETESVTSPFEHLLVASELKRLGVALVSLAPRFVGDFEKGIDFKGDVKQFKEEYIKHLKISEKFGPYKLSVHSGSDKFSVYEAIGSIDAGRVHVKTAGTSYLEALRTIAAVSPALFREIYDFSRSNYEVEKKTYHVSAQLQKAPASVQLSDSDLLHLFDQNDARQVLHVCFGKVLTTKIEDGSYLFRNRIMQCLRENESKHYEFLTKHFRRHLHPFAAL